jgi:hypothetical protein
VVALLRKEESLVLPGEEREEEAEGTVGTSRIHWQRECAFIFQVLLKSTLPHGRAGPGGSHLIRN